MFTKYGSDLIIGVVSGIISGLIVGIVLYLLTLWTEKRKESFDYQNSFDAKEINDIVVKLREVNLMFFSNIELYTLKEDCFSYNIIIPIDRHNFSALEKSESQKIIDLFELVDHWTSDALTLINKSRIYKKDKKVKKNLKKFKQVKNQLDYIPISDMQIVNNIVGEYFFNIIGNKEENIGFEFHSNAKYQYEKLRNPKVFLNDMNLEIEQVKVDKDNETKEILKKYYEEYEQRKKILKVNLTKEGYFYNILIDKSVNR